MYLLVQKRLVGTRSLATVVYGLRSQEQHSNMIQIYPSRSSHRHRRAFWNVTRREGLWYGIDAAAQIR